VTGSGLYFILALSTHDSFLFWFRMPALLDRETKLSEDTLPLFFLAYELWIREAACGVMGLFFLLIVFSLMVSIVITDLWWKVDNGSTAAFTGGGS